MPDGLRLMMTRRSVALAILLGGSGLPWACARAWANRPAHGGLTAAERATIAGQSTPSGRGVPDRRLPGLGFAVVLRPERAPATADLVDDSRVRRMVGVQAVVRLHSGIGVVADCADRARTASGHLRVTWTPVLLRGQPDAGEVAGEITGWAQTLVVAGHVTAVLRDDTCEVWVPGPPPGMLEPMLCDLTGLHAGQVHIHGTGAIQGAGDDAVLAGVVEAIEISRHTGRPVQLAG